MRLLVGDRGRPDDVPEEDWQEILETVPRLSGLLDEALSRWSARELEEALDLYGQARAQYLTVMTAALAHRLDSGQELIDLQPQIQIDLKEWQSLTAQYVGPAVEELRKAKRALPRADARPDEQWDQYRTAYPEAIRAQIQLIMALHQRLFQYDQKRRGAQDMPDPNWPNDLARSMQVLKTATENAQDTLSRDVPQAEGLLYEAQQEYIDLLNRIRPETGDIAAALVSVVSPQPVVLRDALTTPALSLPSQVSDGTWRLAVRRLADVLIGEEDRSSTEQLRNIAFRNLLFLGLVMLIAVVTGLQALWMNKPTFGGADYVTALLWGFGTQGTAVGFSAIARQYSLKSDRADG
jgi:hypothetical protein